MARTEDLVVVGSIRVRLARHPVVMECARVAAAIEAGRCEVVIFEKDRCFVVAGSEPDGVLQPRAPTDAELRVRDGMERLVSANGVISSGFVDDVGRVVGSVTTWTPDPSASADVWHGLCRQVSAVLGPAGRTSGFYESILQGLRDAVIVLDRDWMIRWVSNGVSSLLGRTPVDVIGRPAMTFLHPDDIAETAEAIARFTQGLEVYRVTVRLADSASKWVPVEITGIDFTDDDTIGGMVLSLRYADYESELGSAMDRVQRMSAAVVDGLRDGIVATDEYGAVTLANHIVRAMFGIDPLSPPGSLSLDDFTVVDENGHRRPLPGPAISVDIADVYGCVVTPTGDIRNVNVATEPVRAQDGRLMGTVVVFEDVTAERRATEELRQQALHDQLTGLANRRQLETRLAELSEKSDPPVTVAACFVDLDGFKLVNDNHGHRLGDRVIRIAAERLRHELNETDLLVRQGGDEFVALLVGIDSIEDAAAAANRCVRALAEPYHVDDVRFDLTASIGIAATSSAEIQAQLLLQHADIALYAAKNQGRNRVEIFDESLAEATHIEARQRQLLRDALDNGRLVMHFQPLVDIATSRTIGYEALARVRAPDGELLGPAEFMDAVAHTGLMWDLDRAGLTLSCQAIALLERVIPQPRPRVACNFSAVSLTHPDFLSTIDQIVTESGVNADRLCIEITESAAYEAGANAIAVLKTLQRRGHPIALDDFGTGYSSLAHLRDLPISSVKIDRSFINKLTDHSSERAITQSVVRLARDLGLEIVAEGVETPEQLKHAEELGFATVQGWHYAPALSLADCLINWQDQTNHPNPPRAIPI